MEGSSNVIEGNAIVLYCNIESNPKEVNLSWYKRLTQEDILVGTGTKLQLNVITRRDSCLYVCIATNTIGKGLSETSITVMYAPDVSIQYQNVTKENRVRKLQCNPSGVPKMYAFYDWEHRSEYGDHIRYMTGSKDGILQFHASKYPYQDNGFYTCTASNEIPHQNGMTRQSGSVYLNVKGMPVFTAENKPDFYGRLNASTDITVNVFSNPKYSELLILNQNGIRVSVDGSNIKNLEEHTFINVIIYNSKVKVKGYTITIKIAYLKVKQIQKYTCLIKNKFGQRQYNISVCSGSLPKRPLNVSVFTVEDNVIVKWVCNFDGGFQQTFFIEVREKSSDDWTTIHVPSMTFSTNKTLSWTLYNQKPLTT